MMFMPTNDPEDQISFMDPYSSVLSPFSFNYFEIDGCYDESVLLSGGNTGNYIAESSNEPISASNKGDINGIVEQDHNCIRSCNYDENQSSSKQILCKKRTSKGDRHSKIPTAKGLRDRRMRLSLDVARQFFSLQDELSYDKPSQTVKWLLLQAKSAIEELKEDKKIKGASPTSELGEEVVENNAIHDEISKDAVPKAKEKTKITKKRSFNQEAKDLRKKARERAKERTQMKQSTQCNPAHEVSGGSRFIDVLQSTQCNPAHAVSGGSRFVEVLRPRVSYSEDMRPSLDHVYKIEQHTQDGIIPFGIPDDFTANWSQLMSLNYHQEDQTFQMTSIPEFEFHGASWEPYNYS